MERYALEKLKYASYLEPKIYNKINTVVVPTPMPELAKSFTAKIEWKWLERNITIDVTEVQNGILKMGSQVIEMEGAVTKILIDYTESQYITYTKGIVICSICSQ